MANQPGENRQTTWDHTPPRLALAGGRGAGGGNPPRAAAAAMPPGPPTLTDIFNHAADPRVQIAALQRKLSRPAPTLEYGVKGSVVRSINPQRDRRIQATIDALNRVLSQTVQPAKEPKIEPGKTMQLTPIFNQKARYGR